jgi:Flp pilus assembly protein TadG
MVAGMPSRSAGGLSTVLRSRAPRSRRRGGGRHARGQSLAEFALVLLPLMLVLLGIVQMGLIFNAYVTVANAAREGARAGSIWVADPNASQPTNDANRDTYITATVNGSLGLLDPASATTTVNYDSSTTADGCRGTATDVRRKDQCVQVEVSYRLTLIIPLIADLLPSSGGAMVIPAQSQMVIN